MNEPSSDKDMIRCDDGNCIYYIPRDLFSQMVLRAKSKNKRFVRYAEGAELYSMSMRKFCEVARDAGAIAKIDKLVLVDTQRIDKYIEYYRDL